MPAPWRVEYRSGKNPSLRKTPGRWAYHAHCGMEALEQRTLLNGAAEQALPLLKALQAGSPAIVVTPEQLSAPIITASPTSQTVDDDATVAFTAAATGDPAPSVQWQVSTNGGSVFNSIAGATGATYSFVATTTDNDYRYRAVFTNSQGQAITSAAVLTVPPLAAPDVTTNPATQSVQANNTVTFTAAATGNPVPIVQWQVSTDSGTAYAAISGATSDTYSFTATTAMNGDLFRAIFSNSVSSATTAPARLTVTPGLAAPTGLAATRGTMVGQVQVTWTALIGATSYDVLRGTSSSSLSVIATGVTGDSFSDTGATQGVLYYYSVEAVDSQGTGASAAPVTGYAALPAPASLTAALGTNQSTVAVTWDAVADATSYQIFRGTSSTSLKKIAAGITSTQFDDSTASPGVVYYYSVRAVNAVGLGVNATPVTGFLDLAAPANVTATDNLADEVTITWGAVDGATAYQVFRSVTDDFDTATRISANISTTTFEDTTGSSNQVYYYWVRARNPGIVGMPSVAVTGERM